MNALKNKEINENELRMLYEKMSKNSDVLQSLLVEKDTEKFLEKYNIMLNTEELIEVRKLKEEIIQTVNQNIMILSEKISKITNKRELCNGTCW